MKAPMDEPSDCLVQFFGEVNALWWAVQTQGCELDYLALADYLGERDHFDLSRGLRWCAQTGKRALREEGANGNIHGWVWEEIGQGHVQSHRLPLPLFQALESYKPEHSGARYQTLGLAIQDLGRALAILEGIVNGQLPS